MRLEGWGYEPGDISPTSRGGKRVEIEFYRIANDPITYLYNETPIKTLVSMSMSWKTDTSQGHKRFAFETF